MDRRGVHPFIPNTSPDSRRDMLTAIGVDNVDAIFSSVIPESLRAGNLGIPEPLSSEHELLGHMSELLGKNTSCDESLSFLGGGCWKHYVPAVCDEIISRAEFLTAYTGDTYSDLGKYQAIWEYQSMMGELLEMDVVSPPSYDWMTAATSSILMATRITGRPRVVVADTVSPQHRSHMASFARPWATFEYVGHDPVTGLIDLADLEAVLSASDVGAVYFENPSFLGFVETQGSDVASVAHARGALLVVGVDPSSLGVLAPPSTYGADIVCGDIQPLGNHMVFGGGLAGFIASRDEQAYVEQFPTLLVSMTSNQQGEFGFGRSTSFRTSFERREKSHDFTGTGQWLCGIAAAVYLALMGPAGMRELGEGILARSKHAMEQLSSIEGVRTPVFAAPHFKEFVVSFDEAEVPVDVINRRLIERGIFGGLDLRKEFPELGNSALYCVTEVHSKDDIDRLAAALEGAIAA